MLRSAATGSHLHFTRRTHAANRILLENLLAGSPKVTYLIQGVMDMRKHCLSSNLLFNV